MNVPEESIKNKVEQRRADESREKFSKEQIQSLEKARMLIGLIVEGEKDMRAEKSIKTVLFDIINNAKEMALNVDYGSIISEVSYYQAEKIAAIYSGKQEESVNMEGFGIDMLHVFFCVVPLIEEALRERISKRYFDEIKSYETTGLLFVGSDLDFLFPDKTMI